MSFKKIISIFLTAALLVSALPIFGSAEDTEIFKVGVEAMTATSTISQSPIIYSQGEKITVKIRASQNTGITSLKLLIDYDETALEPVKGECVSTSLFSKNDSLTNQVAATGDGYFIFYSDSYPAVKDAEGVFAVVTFIAKETCVSSTAITVKPFTNGSCVKNSLAGMEVVPFALENQSFAIHKIDKAAGKVTPPTCTEEGYTTYTCDGCKQSVVGNIVPAKGHDPAEAVVENRVEPTCTVNGCYDSVVYCKTEGCHAELSRTLVVIPMLGHAPAEAVVENRVEPNCTDKGTYDSVIYCSREDCKAELSRVAVDIDALGHVTTEAVVENRVEPTCTEKGSYDSVVYCGREDCKAELSRETIEIPALGHVETEAVVENRVEPTCTEKGSYENVVYCGREGCKAELSREKVEIPALGHVETEAVVENRVEPTCSKLGSYENVVYCGREGCKAELSREKVDIPMLPHDLVHHEAQEATHTQIGWNKYDTCKNCDYTTYVEIPMVPYMSGDVNGDDAVTDADAIYLLYATFNSEKYPLNQTADFNKDGEVTDADAIYLLYATFNPEKYPLA